MILGFDQERNILGVFFFSVNAFLFLKEKGLYKSGELQLKRVFCDDILHAM
jgi:hypothetical protein